MDSRVAVVVLAAGSASRFGSIKALALLEGRPLLQHVLDAVDASGVSSATIVVLGKASDDIEDAVVWRDERRVVNKDWELGLAGSLHAGLLAAITEPSVEAVLVVLGDQPRLRPDVAAAIVDVWRTEGGGPIVAPRYTDSGTLNPVLLGRAVWPAALALRGDSGMGPFIREWPNLVTEVLVEGDNPDVDTPADLARLAESEGGEGAA